MSTAIAAFLDIKNVYTYIYVCMYVCMCAFPSPSAPASSSQHSTHAFSRGGKNESEPRSEVETMEIARDSGGGITPSDVQKTLQVEAAGKQRRGENDLVQN